MRSSHPIRILHTEFLLPLKFNETFVIEGALHWTDAVKMNIEYLILELRRPPVDHRVHGAGAAG